MSRYNTIELHGQEYELLYSTKAMMNVAELCGGDLNQLSDWLRSDGSFSVVAGNIGALFCQLVNGAIIARNADITLGLSSGELQKLKNPDAFKELFTDALTMGEVLDIQQAIFKTMEIGSRFNVPEGLKLEKRGRDIDLEEMEMEKGKKQTSGKKG